jgi:hypothetical protein
MPRFRKLLILIFAPAVKIRWWDSVRVPLERRDITLRSRREVIDDHQG